MSESRRDEPLAPRRTLKGPVLPPPAAGQADEARKAEEKEQARQERAAAKTAARERRSAASARRAEQREARPRPTLRERAEGRTPRTAPDVPSSGGGATAAAATAAASGGSAESAADQRPARSDNPVRSDNPARSGSAARSEGATRSQGPARREGSGRGDRPARGGSGSGKPARRTRRAQLRLVQVDAWSVMKTSFLLSIALGIVLVVAVAIVWSVLGAAGVFTNINSVVQQAVGGESGSKFDITQYVGTSRIMGFTMIVAVVDVILITAIATLGAFLYNLSAALLGGIEVTLAEDG